MWGSRVIVSSFLELLTQNLQMTSLRAVYCCRMSGQIDSSLAAMQNSPSPRLSVNGDVPFCPHSMKSHQHPSFQTAAFVRGGL